MFLQHEPVLAMVLRRGSIDVGFRRSEMTTLTYDARDMFLCHRHVEKWIQTDDLHYLSIVISDAALTAASDGTSDEVELPHVGKLVDARVGALVNGYAVRRPSPRIHRGGLTPARLRTVTALVHAKIEDDLTLEEMAGSVELSAAHFSQMFRKSTGQSPHQFVLRHRIQCAKEMLRADQARVLDVAIACGFKTQQHFARVFRQVCGASPTEYRQEFLQ